MRCVVSAALIVTLTASSASAQQVSEAADFASPDRRATATDVPVSSPRAPARDRDGNWSDVREIAPGQEILVTVRDAPVTQRRLVTADAAGITVLDVSDARIPNQVKSVLIDTASDCPDRFALAELGGSALLDRNSDLRLTSSGVLLKGQAIAGLDEIVRRIARSEIITVATEERAIARGIGWGALVGGII